MENKEIEFIEEEKQGISIGDIFKKIWHAKITLGVTFVAVMVVGVLGIQYLYSKPSEKYTAGLTYNFEGAAEGKYPNGTAFNYQSIISLDNLATIKDSNDSYKDVDIDGLVQDNAISITLVPQQVTSETEETTSTITRLNTFTFEASCSYFPNDTIAKSFISDLLNLQYTYAVGLYDAIDYDANLVLANSATTYESQIAYLNAQAQYILTSYDELKEFFGAYAYIKNPSESATTPDTISSKITDITRYFNSVNINALSAEATEKHYLKGSADNEENIVQEVYNSLRSLLVTYNSNQQLVNQLTKQFNELYQNNNIIISSPNDLQTKIEQLVTSNVSIKAQITSLAPKIGYKFTDYNYNGETYTDAKIEEDGEPTYVFPDESYINKVKEFSLKVTEYTNELKEATKYVSSTYSNTTFDYPNIIEKTGGFSIILNLAVSFVVAVILACIVAGIKGHIDIQKEKVNKEEAFNNTQNQ